MTEQKELWYVVEESAQQDAGVGEEFKLRMADIDYDEEQQRFAKYRLRHVETGEILTGTVYC